MVRRPRGLRPEEEALWRKVAETADPLRRKAPPLSSGQSVPPDPQTAPAPIPPFQVGQTARPAATAPAAIRPAAVAMDKKAFGRLKRGKLSPEARIDLHGMTVAAAHVALTAFILRSATEGRRLVLVITGKGKPSGETGPIPERRGILRHQVPHWLDTPPLRQAVLQVTPAHRRHGGDGAYYVYLRRHRE